MSNKLVVIIFKLIVTTLSLVNVNYGFKHGSIGFELGMVFLAIALGVWFVPLEDKRSK